MQAGGQVGVPEAAGQVLALLDERQRVVGLPLVKQDPGSLMQQVGDQVVLPGRRGNGERLLAVALGGGVAARPLGEGGRRGQRPGARQRRPLGARHVKQRA